MTVTTVSLTLAAASSASAAFQGPYAPINWTLTNSNADGFVDTTGAPASISLTGGENGSGNRGTTSYTAAAAGAGKVSFSWEYSTQDDLTNATYCSSLPNNFCDPFSVLLNGTGPILISPSGGKTQKGNYSFNVLTGDTFGFRITTADNDGGRAAVKISLFQAPAPTPITVPEPTSVLSLLALGGLGIGLKCRKRK